MLSFGLSAVGSALASILISGIDSIIYMLLSMAYRLFTYICRIDLFSTSSGYNIYQTFTSRIYQIVGIVTVFVVSYQLLLLIINPDGDSGKKTSTLVKDIVISIVGVIIAPLIFHYMSVVQAHIVEDNTIYNIVLGTSDNTTSADDLSGIVLTSLYHPKGMSYGDFYDSTGAKSDVCNGKNGGENESSYDNCSNWVTALDGWKTNQPSATAIWKITTNGDIRKQIGENGGNDYMWVLCSLVGGFVIFLICAYAIDVATRAIKLGVLEIIAPIPILMRMVNKTWFNNWIKEVGKTYADLFGRIAILAFIVLMCGLVPEFLSAIVDSVKNAGQDVDATYTCIITIILIIGLLMFAKGAIAMFKAIFTGGFLAGLNFNPFATAKTVRSGAQTFGKGFQTTSNHAIGAFRNAAYAVKNNPNAGTGNKARKIGRGIVQGARGFYAGARYGNEKGNEVLSTEYDAIRDGSTFGGRAADTARKAFGLSDRANAINARFDKQRKDIRLDDRKKSLDAAKTSIDNIKAQAEKIYKKRNSDITANFTGNGFETKLNGKNDAEMTDFIETYANSIDSSVEHAGDGVTAESLNLHQNPGESPEAFEKRKQTEISKKIASLQDAKRNEMSQNLSTMRRAQEAFRNKATGIVADGLLAGQTKTVGSTQIQSKDGFNFDVNARGSDVTDNVNSIISDVNTIRKSYKDGAFDHVDPLGNYVDLYDTNGNVISKGDKTEKANQDLTYSSLTSDRKEAINQNVITENFIENGRGKELRKAQADASYEGARKQAGGSKPSGTNSGGKK